MKTLLALTTTMILFITFGVSAQSTQEWMKKYNGPGNSEDIPYSMAVDISGNVYVTGVSFAAGSYDDYATIKYNSSGVQQWVARYNGPGNSGDIARSIAIDASGNVYVTGESYGSAGTYKDYATIKYNSSGVQQWVARYNGPGNSEDIARSIAIDASGNVYVTGHSWRIETNYDFATVKYNSSGVQQWVARYNGPVNSGDFAKSIAIDASGNVYVSGDSYGGGTASSYDYATVKYNSSGEQQWASRYNGTGNGDDLPCSVKLDVSGNVYVTGYSRGSGTDDYATVKYNSSGVQQWAQRYNGTGNGPDQARSMVVDASGNVYVTGNSYGGVGTGTVFATIKYNAAGVQQWLTKYQSAGNVSPTSIALDAYGNTYVTGYTSDAGYYNTVKYSTSGVQQWFAFNNMGDGAGDRPNSIGLDANGNIYIAGSSYGNGNRDYTTIKYSQITGTQNLSSEIPTEFSLSQNYPNPFNPTTKINFELPVNSFVNLKISDRLGRDIKSIINQNLNSGFHEIDFDASDFPSGIYFYTIETEKFKETKKMILIK